MPQEGSYAITVHYRIKRGYTDELVAQCNEFPAVIVQGKTLFDVNQEIIDGVYGYFEAFPEKVQMAIEKQYMVLIENQQQKEQIENKIQSQKRKMSKDQVELEKLAEDQIGTEWQERKLEQVIAV
jgi:adenylate kinase